MIDFGAPIDGRTRDLIEAKALLAELASEGRIARASMEWRRLCIVQVFGCRHDGADQALMRPATEKRQGTKSRWSVWWRCRERYGDLVAAAGLVSLD